MPRFYVSGIIQIEVWAKDAGEAGRKAHDRAVNLMRRSPSLNIGMEEETAEPAPSLSETKAIQHERDE